MTTKRASPIPDKGPGSASKSRPGLNFGCTGQDAARMAEEAIDLLRVIGECDGFQPISGREADFLANIQDKIEKYGKGAMVSGLQLVWLRDIRDRII